MVVLKIPPELKYVDYLIITTCKSRRHIQGLGEIIRKHAKVRLNDMRKVPKLEGSESEWIALDFGEFKMAIRFSSSGLWNSETILTNLEVLKYSARIQDILDIELTKISGLCLFITLLNSTFLPL